jgi:hypothetical protein
MAKPIKYYNETWQEDFEFYIGVSGQDFENAMQSKYGKSVQTKSADGYTVVTPDVICLWTRHKSGPHFIEVLAHECIHAAGFCLDRKGVEASWHNDEPLTYLVSVLIRNVLTNNRRGK